MFKGSLVLTAGNDPIPNEGLEPKSCDFGDRVLAGVLRPIGRSTSSVTRIELPSPRSRRLKQTTSETCSRRGLVSARFAETSSHVTETLLRRAVSETSLRHAVTPLRQAEASFRRRRCCVSDIRIEGISKRANPSLIAVIIDVPDREVPLPLPDGHGILNSIRSALN